MTSLLSRMSPVPGFPNYTGPYKVGTVDLEIPTSELPSPSPQPDPYINTLQCRIFYPCEEPSKKAKPVRWIPTPQREYVGAYAKFLGAGDAVAELFSYVPRLLYYITIPVIRNAPLLNAPTKSKRWPVVVFSHGLGGSRNAYSHLLGSLSSHGVVVIAPDHRDGSAPISFVRDTSVADGAQCDLEKHHRHGNHSAKKAIPYKSLSHTPSREVEDGRNDQLRIRLWELGLTHEVLLKLDQGARLSNLVPPTTTDSAMLSLMKDRLDVHEPGSISWSGHSFGAASTVQFMKSVFYRPSMANQAEADFSTYSSLYTPSASSVIVRQITPESFVSLLDLWCLPLDCQSTRWLWNKPMPCYSPTAKEPGGNNLLAILSEAFFKWRGNLRLTKRVLSPDPSLHNTGQSKLPGPRLFYPSSSAHLSQSDFGTLFAWLTKRVLKVEEPERTLRLNVRAILQVMREKGLEVGETSRQDMEEVAPDEPLTDESESKSGDWKILASGGEIRGWMSVSPFADDIGGDRPHDTSDANKAPSDAVMEGEIMDRDRMEQKL
ncbi:MAG: hypothetical protein M1817_000411 [Caeruleum heppii]|nr:MAG: hypothetical protein M1817_000411 [Caeruleum heppii]